MEKIYKRYEKPSAMVICMSLKSYFLAGSDPVQPKKQAESHNASDDRPAKYYSFTYDEKVNPWIDESDE